MQRFIGIDFSGGVNAGQKIWLASGVARQRMLLIENCWRGEALPDSSRQRAACLAALRTFIRATGDTLIGLDFPVGLPVELMSGQTWLQFIRTFAARFRTPQHFRRVCWRTARGRELKRRTDVEARTPFSPYNLRMYRQTYYGLRDVIAPLVAERAVRVWPLQSRQTGLPSLIEICPASTLKQLREYQAYKGRSSQHAAARWAILQVLQREGVQLADQLRPIVLADAAGDALDSVIAAWAAYRARTQLDRVSFGQPYRREGYVFV